MEQSSEWCQVESEVLADSPSALGCGSELPTRGIAGRMPKSWSSLKQEASWGPQLGLRYLSGTPSIPSSSHLQL